MRERGFTLIEVLVALVLVSIMTLLAWRGVGSMSLAGRSTETHERGAGRLAVALAQWQTDLDALIETGRVSALDFDGQRLRLTRRASNVGDGVVVAVWTIRRAEQGPMLMRLALPAVTTAAQLQAAWERAERWARTPLLEDAAFAVSLVPADSWQIFYFRGDAWSNPQSTAGAATSSPVAAPAAGVEAVAITPPPEGVRLILTLPQGGPLAGFAGKLTRDWVQPTLGATR